MKKIACQYAIVRFLPFVETGEFANAGILLLAADADYFDFRLQTRRYRRITSFFDELDAKTYRATMQALADELHHVRALIREQGCDHSGSATAGDPAQQLFAEIIRPRESIIRFSKPRLVLAEAPTVALDELFSHYVERSFATKERQEIVLERGLRMLFHRSRLGKRFERGQVGDDGFHVSFPFLERTGERTLKAIKALNLAQEQPSRIRDHALIWRGRIDKLRSRGALPERVMFAVSRPRQDASLVAAFDEAANDLHESGAVVIPIVDSYGILQFAAGQ